MRNAGASSLQWRPLLTAGTCYKPKCCSGACCPTWLPVCCMFVCVHCVPRCAGSLYAACCCAVTCGLHEHHACQQHSPTTRLVALICTRRAQIVSAIVGGADGRKAGDGYVVGAAAVTKAAEGSGRLGGEYGPLAPVNEGQIQDPAVLFSGRNTRWVCSGWSRFESFKVSSYVSFLCVSHAWPSGWTLDPRPRLTPGNMLMARLCAGLVRRKFLGAAGAEKADSR